MNDAVGHHGRSGMSQGRGHSPQPTPGTSVGVLQYHTPWSTGSHSRSILLLAPYLLPMRGMARAAKKPSNERSRHDPQE